MKMKNVIRELDKGDHIIQTRKVHRKDMPAPVEYDLIIPKTVASFEKHYPNLILPLAISSLKTAYDDSKMPSAADPIIKELKAKISAVKTPEGKERIRKAIEAEYQKILTGK